MKNIIGIVGVTEDKGDMGQVTVAECVACDHTSLDYAKDLFLRKYPNILKFRLELVVVNDEIFKTLTPLNLPKVEEKQ